MCRVNEVLSGRMSRDLDLSQPASVFLNTGHSQRNQRNIRLRAQQFDCELLFIRFLLQFVCFLTNSGETWRKPTGDPSPNQTVDSSNLSRATTDGPPDYDQYCGRKIKGG